MTIQGFSVQECDATVTNHIKDKELSFEEASKIAWDIVKLLDNLSYRQCTKVLDMAKLAIEETPIRLKTNLHETDGTPLRNKDGSLISFD